MVIALLTAAGVGHRVGQSVPKQFLSVNDKPLIIYTMECFQNNSEVDYIAVVCLSGWESMLSSYARQYGISKLRWIFPGGETGMESIRNAVYGLRKDIADDDIILVQDGIRVNTSNEIISDCIRVTKEKGNAIPAIPIAEAPFYSEDHKSSTRTYDRSKLLRSQTPHGIYYGKLYDLHKRAEEMNITNSVATCTLLVELGETIYFSKGSSLNFKITDMDDVALFKALLMAKKLSWEK